MKLKFTCVQEILNILPTQIDPAVSNNVSDNYHPSNPAHALQELNSPEKAVILLKNMDAGYAIPALDASRRMAGNVTSDENMKGMEQELSEDYAKLAGLTAEEDLYESLWDSMKKRLPWLVLLLGLGLVVSSVVGVFESIVSQVAVVICFQSLILDMAGNVGTQSLAVTIRVLMDEKLSGKDALHFVRKEMRVGGTNGLLLGALSFACVGAYLHFFKGLTFFIGYMVAGCVGLALFLTMVVSSLVGTIIPLLFHKMHVDPAVASGPLITTVNDLVAVIVYYGLAGLLLMRLPFAP